MAKRHYFIYFCPISTRKNMNDKLSISYPTAKRILLELLENNDFSNDVDIMEVLGSVVHKKNKNADLLHEKVSKIVIDKDGGVYLPDYSPEEVKMPYLPRTVFFFFLLHPEGIEFKSMYTYLEELYNIYQIVASKKNTEALKMKLSLDNLVEPVNNRIYENCSLIRKSLSKIVPEDIIDIYCIKGKRGGRHHIEFDRRLVLIQNEKLKEMFNRNEDGSEYISV